MHQLSVTVPEIHQEFMDGGHPISRSTQPFRQVWTDMALEQSVNLDSKSKEGIVGISLNPGAIKRWFLTVHERAAITTQIKSMCSMGVSEKVSRHKETGSRHHAREEDVQKMMTMLTVVMTNLFDLDHADDSDVVPLLDLTTGVENST